MSEYIKLQLKLGWGFNKNDSKKSFILTTTMGLIVAVVMLGIVYLFASILAGNLTSVDPTKLATMFISVVEIGLLVISITMQIKKLYRPADLLIAARFPISAKKMYFASIILVFINLMIYSFILVFPVTIVYGWAADIFSLKLVLGAFVGSLLAPLAPFAISLLLAIPIMYFMSAIEGKNILKLVLFIAILVAAFILYDYILTVLAKYFVEDKVSSGNIDVWASFTNGINTIFNPAVYLKDIIFFTDFGVGIGITLAITAVFGTAGIFVAMPVYSSLRKRILEGGGARFSKVTKINNSSAGEAMFKNGFLNILRNRTYAYFYLGIAVATPVMVFLCNKLISDVGTAKVGSTVNFGASVLVIAAFMAMISAFSGVSISMEGRNFYISKIVPIPYRKQMILKAVLNLLVSAGALIISLVLLVSLKFISILQMFVLLVSMLVLAFGFVLNGLNINLANPDLKQKASGETDEINITITMIIGLFLSALFGGLSIILPFFININYVYPILAGLVLIYSGVNALVFGLTCEKKYSRIEV